MTTTTTINSSDLDFDTIKSSLKTYLQSKSEFNDYNFEASGLSNILDVLAYNTHLNGLVANFGINESFLNSAQLRSSVVSHAENLGYYPRSKTGSSATITLSVASTDTSTATLTLPKFSSFTADVDGTTYSFRTTEVYTAVNDGSGNFSFTTSAGSTSIPIKEGTEKTTTFLDGETTDDQDYVIPDENVDTTTLSVNVFDTTTSSSFDAYTNVNNSVRINTTSTVYIVREVPNGYYELTFSDGTILGKAPSAGNKIEVKYLSSLGAAANGATTFSTSAVNFDSAITGDYTITATKVSESSGGAEKESLDSIKVNAPVGFATQQRMVTAEDYKAIILENYSSVLDDVAAWGGNDNIPAVYGRVYVSLKFKDGTTDSVKTETKGNIISNLTDNLAIMSIDTEYSDPVTSYLQLTTTFNFDPDQTNLTSQATETLIENTIQSFFNDNLNTFGTTFRRSNLLTDIDALSPAILNSKMDIRMQQRFTPTLNTSADYTIAFPQKIAAPDDVLHTVHSTPFTYNGVSAKLECKLTTNIVQIVNDTNSTVIVDNIGTFDSDTGTVSLIGFNVSAISGTEIKITVRPANQSTIRPLRGYILSYDTSVSAASAILDTQETAASISTSGY
jgi:hypothetical protein